MGANSFVCTSYRRKAGRGDLFALNKPPEQPKVKVILVIEQIECTNLGLKGYNFILKYVKSEQNVYDSNKRHPCKDLLKVEELIHYVSFVANGARPNVLTIDNIKKATKNHKLLHQVIKSARWSNCCELNKTLSFLDYNGNRNTLEYFLKTDSKLTVDHNLVLKSKWTVIPSEHQHHVIPLTH